MKTSDIKQRQKLKNCKTGEILQVSIRDNRQRLLLIDPISKKAKISFEAFFLSNDDELTGWEVV